MSVKFENIDEEHGAEVCTLSSFCVDKNHYNATCKYINMSYYIGIDIGGTKIALGLFNHSRELLLKEKLRTNLSLSPDELFSMIVEGIDKLLGEVKGKREDVAGIGVGAPSSVNYEDAHIISTANIADLCDYNVRDALVQHFVNARVLLDNDANVAALAEFKHGAGRGFKHMIYSTASTGIGGGIIINEKLFRGSYDSAGEIGHAIITPDNGVTCGCLNRGCFESYASGANINKHVQLRVISGEKTVMTELTDDLSKVNGEILMQAFLMGDKMATEILDQIGGTMGLLFFNLYQILNINCFVVGGGLNAFGDNLFDRINSAFNHFIPKSRGKVYIKPAELKQDFGIIGACELIFE